MTDHLPDCFMREPFTIDRPGICICDRLRACERRIREDDKNTFLRAAYDTGRIDALDAAREAVERAYRKDSLAVRSQTEWGVEIALTAIDALREEKP